MNSENIILSPSQLPSELPKGFVLLVDKPLGWSSFDVVNKVRYALQNRPGVKKLKIGHAGTLDPLATGLLILCVGEYTRRIETFQGQEKEYTGTITFGAVTASFDLEKPVEPTEPPVPLDPDVMEKSRQSMIGEVMQYPPVFSAVKVDGKRLYTNARSGTDVDIQARQVSVSVFDLGPVQPIPATEIREQEINVSAKGRPIWQFPDFAGGLQSEFRIVCGKGTYIRSMAFEIGEKTGSGAYLSSLRRTRIGAFSVENAWSVEALVNEVSSVVRQ